MISVLPVLDVDADFLARLHAVKEHRRRQHAGVRIACLVLGQVGKNTRVQQVTEQLTVVDWAMHQLLDGGPGGGEIGGRQRRSRPSNQRLPATEHALLQLCREAARRLAQPALEELHHRFGKRQLTAAVGHLGGVRLLATMNRAMSPTTFDVGVTLMMSPNSRLTSAYIRQTSRQRSSRPSDCAC